MDSTVAVQGCLPSGKWFEDRRRRPPAPPPPPPPPPPQRFRERFEDPPLHPPPPSQSLRKQFEDPSSPEFCRVVTLEEARRLMKIGPKRSNAKGDDEPIYKEDVERAREKQTKKYVAMALDHYNATTEGPKYELVEAIGVNGIVRIGLWYHVCFIAKPVSTATDASPKHFFAEIAYHLGNAISCRIVDLNSPDTIDGCGSCAPNGKMYHPRGGFEVGDWPYYEPAEISAPEGYYDASVPMERRVKFCLT